MSWISKDATGCPDAGVQDQRGHCTMTLPMCLGEGSWAGRVGEVAGARAVAGEDVDPARFEGWDFERFLLQPMDGPDREANTAAAIAYCLAHPRWRLSVQTHKYLGIA